MPGLGIVLSSGPLSAVVEGSLWCSFLVELDVQKNQVSNVIRQLRHRHTLVGKKA